VGNRVSQIGNINFFNFSSIYYDIISILDHGFKFIPNFKSNHFSFFQNILKNFENELLHINSNIFFKSKDNSSSSSSNIHSENLNKDSYYLNFDNFFRSTLIKKKFNFSSLFVKKETIDFKFEFFKNVSNINFNEKLSNLEYSKLISIQKFNLKKYFKVLDCDKNIGAAIISNELFNSISLDHLNSCSSYKKLDSNPLSNTISLINDKLKFLLDNKHISKKLFNHLLPSTDSKLGTFRFLPKLHKSKFSIRPIINCRW
jgi:hypothetical protein